jgi:hypothetical protein
MASGSGKHTMTMKMTPSASRSCIQLNSVPVISVLVPEVSAKLLLTDLAGTTVARWLNVELPELVNRRVDLLGETDDGTLIQIDLQSGHDKTMALRMAEYALAIYRLFGKFPRQVVLYVGEAPLKMDDSLAGPDLQFRYCLIDVRDLDGERLRESPEMGDKCSSPPDEVARSERYSG